MTPCPKPRVVKKARQPLRAKKRMKRYNAKRKGSAFPKNVDAGFRDWLASQWRPCVIARRQKTGTFGEHICFTAMRERCHVKSRGAGGRDAANIVMMCPTAHDEQHRIGTRSFERRWGVNLKAEAEKLWAQYQAGATPTQEKR